MKENLIQEHYQKLLDSGSPHLILAAFYQSLFDKSLQTTEWGILRRAISLYGREVVFDAMVRTASSTTVDTSKSLWPYINSICVALVDVLNRLAKQSTDTSKAIDRTTALLEELKQINPEIVELITQEEFYGDTTAK